MDWVATLLNHSIESIMMTSTNLIIIANIADIFSINDTLGLSLPGLYTNQISSVYDPWCFSRDHVVELIPRSSILLTINGLTHKIHHPFVAYAPFAIMLV